MFKITEAHRAPHLPPGILLRIRHNEHQLIHKHRLIHQTVMHLIACESNLALLAHNIFNHSLTVRLIHIKTDFGAFGMKLPYEPGQIVLPRNAGCI